MLDGQEQMNRLPAIINTYTGIFSNLSAGKVWTGEAGKKIFRKNKTSVHTGIEIILPLIYRHMLPYI